MKGVRGTSSFIAPLSCPCFAPVCTSTPCHFNGPYSHLGRVVRAIPRVCYGVCSPLDKPLLPAPSLSSLSPLWQINLMIMTLMAAASARSILLPIVCSQIRSWADVWAFRVEDHRLDRLDSLCGEGTIGLLGQSDSI